MSMKFYILDDDHQMVEVPMMEWAEWFEAGKHYIAADKGKGWWMSSIFLGFDHTPLAGGLLYETMIVQGMYDEDRDFFRFTTYDECIGFHRMWVNELRGIDHE
jgi:hypothetical protein